MGIKRIVDVQFWNDDKVIEHFSPEDKLFMLYLITNPHTTQLGIYTLNKKLMSFELGYTIDVISVLLDRFENKYNIIRYSQETSEIAIKNYLRHSIIKGGAPVRDCLIKEMKMVKNKELILWVLSNLKNHDNLNDTVNNIIREYEEKNGELSYYNEKQNDNEDDNDNENENDNEVSYPVSYHDTYHDTLASKKSLRNLEEEFEMVWKEYPRKQGKSNACKAYIKARKKGVEQQTILDGIFRYLDYIRADKTDIKYVKQGSTWFNQECWNDDYTIKRKATTKDIDIDISDF